MTGCFMHWVHKNETSP